MRSLSIIFDQEASGNIFFLYVDDQVILLFESIVV